MKNEETIQPEHVQRLTAVYSTEVLHNRNRSISLLGRKCQPRIIYTLLGYEVKAGNKRITCPDTVTARYLSLFSEIGMDSVRIPYDPTLTARIIGELEGIMQAVKADIRASETDPKLAQKALTKVFKNARARLKRAEKHAIPAVNASRPV